MDFISDIAVELVDVMASDESVIHSARVCVGKDRQVCTAEDHAVINYLMKHRHGTPFEHNCFKFRVHAPIFVWREHHRHRIGFSYNEESGRYKTLDPVFYIPARDRPMMKVDKWKPGRPKFELCESDDVYCQLVDSLGESYKLAYENYLENLELGIDPGLARDCLPVGIYSSCYVTCNARSLMAFLSLRQHHPNGVKVSYPLWEIEMVAKQYAKYLEIHMPVTYAAFVENGYLGP